jgi:hypothetical protein
MRVLRLSAPGNSSKRSSSLFMSTAARQALFFSFVSERAATQRASMESPITPETKPPCCFTGLNIVS